METIKCIPHISYINWEVTSTSVDQDKDIMTVNLIGMPVVDYLDIEICLTNEE